MSDFKVSTPEQVLSEIFDLTSKSKKEVGGLLLGRFEKQKNILSISDHISGPQSSSFARVSLSDELLVQATAEIAEKGANVTIIGWYHSHPGMGLFMSSVDVKTQKRYQSLFPEAVALVVDPIKRSFKFFRLSYDDNLKKEYWKEVAYQLIEEKKSKKKKEREINSVFRKLKKLLGQEK